MLVSSRSSEVLYSVDPASLTYTGTSTGFKLFLARSAGGVRFAASLQDGVLMEPASTAAAEPGKAVTTLKSDSRPDEATTVIHPALPH
jgi:hypothetical protein